MGAAGWADRSMQPCRFPVPARSAESAKERLDRQHLVVERVAIIRNAKNGGIDMIDRERGQARSICQQRGQVAGGRVAVGLPRTALWSVGGRPRSRGAAVIPLDT